MKNPSSDIIFKGVVFNEMKGALVCYFYASFYYYVIYFHFKTLSYVFSLVLPTIFLCKILSKHLKAKSTVPFCPGFQFLLLDIQLFNPYIEPLKVLQISCKICLLLHDLVDLIDLVDLLKFQNNESNLISVVILKGII